MPYIDVPLSGRLSIGESVLTTCTIDTSMITPSSSNDFKIQLYNTSLGLNFEFTPTFKLDGMTKTLTTTINIPQDITGSPDLELTPRILEYITDSWIEITTDIPLNIFADTLLPIWLHRDYEGYPGDGWNPVLGARLSPYSDINDFGIGEFHTWFGQKTLPLCFFPRTTCATLVSPTIAPVLQLIGNYGESISDVWSSGISSSLSLTESVRDSDGVVRVGKSTTPVVNADLTNGRTWAAGSVTYYFEYGAKISDPDIPYYGLSSLQQGVAVYYVKANLLTTPYSGAYTVISNGSYSFQIAQKPNTTMTINTGSAGITAEVYNSCGKLENTTKIKSGNIITLLPDGTTDTVCVILRGSGLTPTLTITESAGTTPITPIVSGQTINTSLVTAGKLLDIDGVMPCDQYSFSGTVGQTVTITQHTTAFTPVCYLVTPNKTKLLKGSDANFTGQDSIISSIKLLETGTHYIQCSQNSGDPGGSYSITLNIV